jgi:hypothetical protein
MTYFVANLRVLVKVDNETKHLNVVEMTIEPKKKYCPECGSEMNERNPNDICFSCIEKANQRVNAGWMSNWGGLK